MNAEDIEIQPVKVVYLKMATPPEMEYEEDDRISFKSIKNPVDCGQYLHYYKTVGLKLHWLDRLMLKKIELSEKINASNVHIYVMENEGHEAGF